MRKTFIAAGAAVALALCSVAAVTPAQARWHHWHHGWGPGAAIGGFAAGALLGSAIAGGPYYGPGYYGYYGPGPYAYEAPGYGGNAVAYCEQRFKSYDPASGTYLGYDGMRHPCP